jgi:hypothetical protein
MLSSFIEEADPVVTATINSDGVLVAKPSALADYTCRPQSLHDLCLWDFLSLCDKVRWRNHNESTAFDNDDDVHTTTNNGESLNPSLDFNRTSHCDNCIVDSFTSMVDSIYLQHGPSSTIRFRREHPEYATHGLRIVPYREKYVLVPLGPPLPRFDRDSTREAYCRLMVVLFKPWIAATDLKQIDVSWTECYRVMLESEHIHYEHKILMDNIQFLHDCRDDRNRDIKQRSSHLFSENYDDRVVSQTELCTPPLSCDLSELQDRHDLLLGDIQQQTVSNTTRRDDCLNSIALTGFANCDSVVLDADEFLNDGSADLSTMRHRWKSEYVSRRKAIKEQLRSTESNSVAMMNNEMRYNTTSQVEIHSLSNDVIYHNSSSLVPNIVFPSSQTTMDLCDFSDAICNRWTLNSDQKRAFFIIAKHAFNTATDSPLSMLITGPAGSGKSQVLTAMRDFFTIRNESRRFRCASYMGIAANNISGVTLHSALNLTPGLSSIHTPSHKSIEELKYMWIGVDYLFIDEISMISCEFLHTISVTLTRATGKTLPFGGLSVIFAGDLAQLPPVAETRLSAWLNPKQACASDRSQRKLKGKLLWLSVTTVVVLEKINRQSGVENAPFVDLLSRLREGCCTSRDYQLLNSRVVSPVLNITQWNIGIKDFAPIIVCDNTTKDAVNLEIARIFAAKTGQPFFTYVSKDEIEGSPITNPTILQIIDLLHSGRTSNRLNRLPIALQMPVMITTNIDLAGGIVNGSIGTIRAIDFTERPNGDRVLNHCIVHIPSAHADAMHGLSHHEYPVLPETVSVRYQGSKSKQSVSFKRTQLPLIPAFAMTAHKSQGQTMDKAIIDLTTCRRTETPYVMVSRVRRLQDLLILRPFPIGKIKCRMSEDTRREQTRHRYYHFITTSKHGSPPEQQDALKEIDIIKQKFTSHELDDILGTNIVNDQTITTPDRRPSKRRKVSVVLLFLTANRNRRRSQVQSSRSTLTS